MEKIKWVSEGTIHRAVKLSGHDELGQIDIVVADLVKEGCRPTVIIGGHEQIRDIKTFFHSRMLMADLIDFDYAGVDYAGLVVDHRVKDAIYILYAAMDLSELEAPQFAGLDELP